MKRAAVWKGKSGRWWVDVLRVEDWDPLRHISCQGPVLKPWPQGYPTHAAALAHALQAVGLTPTNPEEQNR